MNEIDKYTDKMHNKRMQEKILRGDAIDLSGCKRTPEGYYILTHFVEDVDYCDKQTEQWIWSIGRHNQTGEILASIDTAFYNNPTYTCLWLR